MFFIRVVSAVGSCTDELRERAMYWTPRRAHRTTAGVQVHLLELATRRRQASPQVREPAETYACGMQSNTSGTGRMTRPLRFGGSRAGSSL